ncbi:MAG: polysaccharide deacetylase family protein [Candidatus Heimdallarchaeota archaeon]|nr:polysaccharide deacetylase family protein [Candidatus Heimdallarchaeota archaeon]MCK4610120.1 polysaccharide deacetylase family protein [Candidatus Heimdallarchaeota archaeon]
MNTETHFCLRVDVDTFEGLKKGIPQIYNIVKRLGIPTTIYLSLGKYATGRNIFRKIRHKEKISFTISPWRRNSIQSLFRGVLLPPARIRESAKSLLKNYNDKELFEIHPHGYNHVEWSSSFSRFSFEKTSKFIEKIFIEYNQIFNSVPITNAAPNFQTNKYYFQIMKEKGVEFLADYKYSEPFQLQFETTEKKSQQILQLPVTEPTFEELLQKGKGIEEIKKIYRKNFKKYTDQSIDYVCFYLHAIYEPFKLRKLLEDLFNLVIKLDMKPVTHKNYKDVVKKTLAIRYEELIQR